MRVKLLKTLAVLAAIFFAVCVMKVSPRPFTGERADTLATSTAPDRSPLKLPLISPRIVVKKAERKLFLYSNNKIVRTYHVGLGLSPVGDKVREGDRRTP